MELSVTRDIFSPNFTLGKFFIDGKQEYFTVERPFLNGANTPETTCILPGKYEVVITESPHFERPMPRLLDVPQRNGILIHPANYASELKGCIAIGLQRTKDGVGASQVAFTDFFEKLRESLAQDKVLIIVG